RFSKAGWTRRSKEWCEAAFERSGRGGSSLPRPPIFRTYQPPRLRQLWWLRNIFLMAQPPRLGKAGSTPSANKPESHVSSYRSLLTLCLLPLLLLSCGAMWQSDKKSPVELARIGMYKEAEAALEPMVNSGNFDPLV